MFSERLNLPDGEPFPRAYYMAFRMGEAVKDTLPHAGQFRFTLSSFLRILEELAALAREDRDAASNHISSVPGLADQGRVAELMDDIPCYVSILKAMSEKERNDDLLTDDDRVEELAAITGTTSSRVHQLLAELRQAKSMCGRIGQFLSSAQSGVWPP